MVCLVDTNIFLRLLIKEDERAYNDCYNFLELVKNNRIRAMVSNLVLYEVVWTLDSYYEFSRKDIYRAINGILNTRGLRVVDGYDSKVAIKLFYEKKVKFIDAMLASIPEVAEKKWMVMSYDQEFDKLGVVRKEPRDVGLVDGN